jgi:hypothetical protein
MHYQSLLDGGEVEVRVHDTTLYNSIYRFDDELLVNMHVLGCNAFATPVMHLRRLVGGQLVTTYVQCFEAVWETSRPTS